MESNQNMYFGRTKLLPPFTTAGDSTKQQSTLGDRNDTITRTNIVINILRWFSLTGCLLVGPCVSILVISFTFSTYKDSTKVYCDDLKWSEDVTPRPIYDALPDGTYKIVGTDECRYYYASDVSCPSDQARLSYITTVSNTIEHWPYAMTLVFGVGSSNIFICVFVAAQLANDPTLIVIGYISFLSVWAVVGTSEDGGNRAIEYLHYVFATVMVTATLTYVVFIYTYRNENSIYTGIRSDMTWVTYIHITLLLLSAIVMVVSVGAMAYVGGGDAFSDHTIRWVGTCLGVSELVYVNCYSIAMYNILQFVLGRITSDGGKNLRSVPLKVGR